MFSPLFTFIYLLHSGTIVCGPLCDASFVISLLFSASASSSLHTFFFACELHHTPFLFLFRFQERERGRGGRSKCRAKSVWRLQQRSRRHRRRDVFMAHASVWSCISASLPPSLALFLHLTDASLPFPPFPSSLVYLPSFCCPCIVSFSNQFVLC